MLGLVRVQGNKVKLVFNYQQFTDNSPVTFILLFRDTFVMFCSAQ